MTRPILFRMGLLALIVSATAALAAAVEGFRSVRAAASRGDLPVLHLGRAEP